MFLFKNANEDNRIHNVLGWDFIVKTDDYYIECSLDDGLVDMISYTNRKNIKKYEDYELFLDECYELVAFCKDIKIVLGMDILANNQILSNKAIQIEGR